MSEIGEIRDALVGALGAVPGLNGVTRMTNVIPPAAIVEFAGAEYHDASMAEPLYRFAVTVLVGTGDLAASQDQLDAYVSRDGVRAALEDAELGDATVLSAGPYRRLEEGGSAYLGSTLTVIVRP
ncbi:MAG TPA: hypothetical protein VFT76_01960 [Actinomycetota bacterium]|nr:hypothetical protein [Actinomycetota bacterium]